MTSDAVAIVLGALADVEWVAAELSGAAVCPWCSNTERQGHALDCDRQRAIDAVRRIWNDRGDADLRAVETLLRSVRRPSLGDPSLGLVERTIRELDRD